MHTATEFHPNESLLGGLSQWIAGVWKQVSGEAAAPAGYPILADAEFAHALVGLAAKLVAVDGQTSTAEYAAFRSLFPAGDEAKLRSQFMRAMNDSAPALQYARAIRTMFPDAVALHHEVMDRLMKVASADGALNAAEHELLCAVAG